MEARVREILSWYSSDNPGTRTNLARLLNHGRLAGTGRLVILPVDQGFEHGPADIVLGSNEVNDLRLSLRFELQDTNDF